MQENPSYELVEAENPARILLFCDHASNFVPKELALDLGLPPAEMGRHIAYDIGAKGMTLALSRALNAPAILTRFSRLVIDPNRGEDDPTLVMRLYDGTLIPGNRHADREEVTRRLDLLHRPYHQAADRLLDQMEDPVLISIHSFTPQLRGRPLRPWEIGLLYSDDDRIARPLMARLRSQTDMVIGDNQPYHGKLKGDCMDRHGLSRGHAHVLIEIRNDLIETPAGQADWAARLAPHLTAVIAAYRKENAHG